MSPGRDGGSRLQTDPGEDSAVNINGAVNTVLTMKLNNAWLSFLPKCWTGKATESKARPVPGGAPGTAPRNDDGWAGASRRGLRGWSRLRGERPPVWEDRGRRNRRPAPAFTASCSEPGCGAAAAHALCHLQEPHSGQRSGQCART